MAQRIKELRLEKQLTLLQLANAIGVSEGTVQRYESGNIRNLKYDTIVALSNVLGTTPAYLMGWDENRIHPPHNHASIPVLGSIPAGTPLDAVQDIRGYIDVPTAWVDDHGALIVIGDSMSPKYLDGDTVIFRIQPDCENGQDCVVYVNGYDATLKKVIKTETGIILQPLNPEFEPIICGPDNPVTILGVVVELRRKV